MNNGEKKEYRENKSFLINFGKQVRIFRQQKGLTQEQLFLITGIAADKISQIENGKLNTGISNIPCIAHALGKTVIEIMDFEYEKVLPLEKIKTSALKQYA